GHEARRSDPEPQSLGVPRSAQFGRKSSCGTGALDAARPGAGGPPVRCGSRTGGGRYRSPAGPANSGGAGRAFAATEEMFVPAGRGIALPRDRRNHRHRTLQRERICDKGVGSLEKSGRERSMNEPGDSILIHATEETLQRLADAELSTGDAGRVRRHLADCGECRSRLDRIEEASETYLAYHRNALQALDPAPPRAWEDLRPKMRQMDASSSRARGGHWRIWLAFAAGLIVAVALYYRMNRPEPVSAAGLLRKAVSAEPAHDARRRIRVRTKSRSVVRPAVLPAGHASGGDGGVELLFLSAHFSWLDPLSASSFAAWREQLPEKEDRVRTADSTYEIRTTTAIGVLREAVLILRAGDLQPLSETLRFMDETVEISAAEPALDAGGRS